jgi:predicted Zn-dependent protease
MAMATISVNQAFGQFSTSKSEIERSSRLTWLRAKINNPKPENPAIQIFVECIASQLIEVLPDEYSDLDWEIVVFQDDSPNAYALLGGKIGVNTGIFSVAETPDALAAVIGHEIAHLTEDHVFERAQRFLAGEALNILGTAATGLSGTTRAATALGFTLPFSRLQESEADIVGLNYMSQAGFDPRSTINLWKNMSEQGDQQRSEFSSTHPSDSRRLSDLVSNMTSSLIAYNSSAENSNNCLNN